MRNTINSAFAGRYVFPVRNGIPAIGEDSDTDGVTDERDNCPRQPNADQRDATLNGLGDACETPGQRHASALFLEAGMDRRTSVEAVSRTV